MKVRVDNIIYQLAGSDDPLTANDNRPSNNRASSSANSSAALSDSFLIKKEITVICRKVSSVNFFICILILSKSYDGTLKQYSDKEKGLAVEEKDKDAISTFRKKGNLFGIVTGRFLSFPNHRCPACYHTKYPMFPNRNWQEATTR